MTRLKLAILISGRGSNMEAILEAARDPAYPAQPVLVLSNRPDAKGLETATAAGIATAAIDHKTYGKDREAFERAMHEQLTEAGVEIIALAGFMRVLTPWFVNKWQGRMVNIHPSLLPKYKGLDTHQRALDAGDTEAGCTVHWVSPGVDDGEIIQQASLPILPGDTADSLAARLLPVEHRLYPEALTKACAEIQTRA
ncbi:MULTISPECIES: phosphoribosylglycinamide formyltransferase [unclassified Hyphomonas]|jgi:formyltetrahydrofolate-dependent phosphoribosylglycinamide formyltransferase|uniref:phosphoribosylglycinamide formyltransferase n=3 Tax=Hyphomonas TaxID=85 RepID=UPI000C9449A9|nr:MULTISPECIES: phosphoribosylglycinamide formyltransferase [unclassified Hyphomonas]MAL42454.1 phosphoribosylglycinamide formyltransferase [Hyphomonas sp.]RCL89275.1 MAG: phosphoribosylglycinamide formyltransferase [Hyphomonas sp.]HAW54163.1 phosphoribosylglycinamide formyltransferase [Hyphomonas sp.]HBX94228.1 phosphoribosylglycinamide formyltransferase [Hyphomonas sp.]|tara:strand:- start:344 stop:934 length:591 start_codon:yes stop_codon:yes gene_type:complete